MSRSDQLIGLNKRAEAYLKENEFFKSNTPVSMFETAWNGLWPLYEYTKIFWGEKISIREFVQAEPWSSGPCYFLALCGNYGPIDESLWKDKEIREHTGW